MEKGNKIRLVLWGLVWIIVVVASIYGISSYYKGYGETGKIRKELMPIIKEFNKLNAFETYKKAGITIEASLMRNGIKVIYNTSMANLNFVFNYETIEDQKVLHTKYNKVDEATGIFVVSSMFDTVSILQGHYEGDLFERFGYGDLYNTTIALGGKLTVDANETHAYINVNKTLLDTMTEEVIDMMYIKEDDIQKINNELSSNNLFTYTKSETKLFVEATDSKYVIYVRNGNYDDNLYKSILSVINALNIDTETKDEFERSYPMISTSTEFGNYIITVDTDVSNMTYFDKKDHVVKVEVTKGTNTSQNNNKTAENTNGKQIKCLLNITSVNGPSPDVIATLDKDEKVYQIEMQSVFETEAKAKEGYELYKAMYGDNVVRNKNVLTIKNLHDPNTYLGSVYSKAVGNTVEEFYDFMRGNNYTCN